MEFKKDEINLIVNNVFEKMWKAQSDCWFVIGLPMVGRSTLLKNTVDSLGGEYKDFALKVVNLPEEVEPEIETDKKYIWIINSLDSVTNEKRLLILKTLTKAYYQNQENHKLVFGLAHEEIGGVKDLLGGSLGLYYATNRFYLSLNESVYPPLVTRQSQMPNVTAEDKVVGNIFEAVWECLSEVSQEQLMDLVRGKPKEFSEYLIKTGLVVDNKVFSPIFYDWLKIKLGENKSRIEKKEGKLWLNGETSLENDLSFQEYSVLDKLFEKKGEMLSRNEVAEILWSKETEEKYSDWAIDQVMSKLRKKIGDVGEKRMIKTIKGQGFVFSQE